VSNNLAGSGIDLDNESYRKYREDVGMGQDFFVYSTIKYYNINDYTFEL
jgi:hypothetical protein